MIPFGNQTVTLFHKANSTYTRYVLSNCSWRQKNIRIVSDGAVIRTVETVCRIPNGQQKPTVGDLLVLGVNNATVSNDVDASRMRDSVNSSGGAAFRAQSVKDNTNAPIPHFCAAGE